MTIEIILSIVIVITLIIIALLHSKYSLPFLQKGSTCPCGCGDRSSCQCRRTLRQNSQQPDIYMEVTGPYELPEEPTPRVEIIAEVDTYEHVPSRTNHVGSIQRIPARVTLSTETIYSQFGDETGEEPSTEHKESFVSNFNIRTNRKSRENFVEKINNTRKVYLHYTEWCGYCKKMKPVWEQVKTVLSETGIEFYEIDEDVAKTPGVNGYPTILMIDENGFRSQYPGASEFEQLRAWCVARK